MMAFIRKLFAPLHLKKYNRQLENFSPEMREALAIKPQFDIVPNASERFGYDQTNPIPVCLQKGELDYLACLRCGCGEPFMFHRIGGFGSGPDGHTIDGYELICRNRQHHVTLYMDMYHAGSSTLSPDGLTIGSPKGIGLPFWIEDFPDGVPQAIKDTLKKRN